MSATTYFDHDLEKTILSIGFVDKKEFHTIANSIEPRDFHNVLHRQIYGAMLEIHRTGAYIDNIMVSDIMKRKHGFDDVIKILDVVTFLEAWEAWANLPHIIPLLKKLTAQRDIQTVCSKLATDNAKGYLNGNLSTYAGTLGAIDRRLMGAAEATTEDIFSQMHDHQVFRAENPGSLQGIPTGFDELDRLLDGLISSKVYIIAARTKVGKSIAALSIANNVVSLCGDREKVAIFSLEMTGREVGFRMASIRSRVGLTKMKGGLLTEPEWDRYNTSVSELKPKLLIDDTPGMSASHIKKRLQSWQDEGHDIKLVIIDHMHIMKKDGPDRGENDKVLSISNDLIAMGKVIGAPMLVLCQVNKGVDDRENKRPMEGDVKYSGAIGESCQAMITLYRDDHYNPELSTDPNIMEMIVRLNREGPQGTVRVYFDRMSVAAREINKRELTL